MIVDCHTQLWDSKLVATGTIAAGGSAALADETRHLDAVHPVDRAIVLGFKSRYLDAGISNQFVADYVKRYSAKLVGFAGIDPTDPGVIDEIRVSHEELGLKGVTLSPSLQNFHPADTRAEMVYEECERRGLPIVFEHGQRNPAAKLEFARPLLLDEVARDFPRLRIVVAHMGFPWVEETVVLLGKHQNVFSDVSGLLPKRWLSYNALLSAYEYGVMDKLLFGSEFPYRSPAQCIEALYSLNQLVQGTNLAPIPREQLRGVVERDALALLGIEQPIAAAPVRSRSALEEL